MSTPFFNSDLYFQQPLIHELGFREYDARWIVEPIPGKADDVEINYRGLTLLGNRLGVFLQRPENGGHEAIVAGHDFRRYSENVKNALVVGLLSSGLDVADVGLALSPMVYYAQYRYDIGACAMVTGSHNPNGWTGIKMGYGLSKTFGPERMKAFKEFVLGSGDQPITGRSGGRYTQKTDLLKSYSADLWDRWAPLLQGLPRPRVAVETGNGTAGMVLPPLLEKLGFPLCQGHIKLDWDFPHFNPNPESIPFLKSVQQLVKEGGADVGICIDGDGDRIGVVDDRGRIVYSDRVALVLARKLESLTSIYPPQEDRPFVIDVKSTSIFSEELRSRVVWEKTGHSYIKRAIPRENAIAGFERSGHFFITAPFGRGYDDASLAALLLLWILAEARAEGRRLSDLLDEFPRSHQSPNRQPVVPDHRKYAIIEEITDRIVQEQRRSGTFGGAAIDKIITINGVRVFFKDRSWLLIRASSNTPNFVIMAESFDEDGSRLKEIDGAIRTLLKDFKDVGPFDPLHEV